MAAALCFAPDVVGIIGMATDHGAEVALRTELTPNTWRENGLKEARLRDELPL